MVKVEHYVENIRANYGDFLLYIIEKNDADDLRKLLAYVLLGEYEFGDKLLKVN